MKVLKNNSPSFGSLPIYRAKLKQPLFLRPFLPKADVFISEIDATDLSRVGATHDYWAKTDWGGRVVGEFENFFLDYRKPKRKKRFFVVETAGGEPEKRKIKGFACVTFRNNYVFLNFLQSQRQKRKCFSQTGIGSCLLYLVSRLANVTGKNCIELNATAKSINFYEKQKNFDHIITTRLNEKIHTFQLPRKRMNSFERELSEKYSITPILNEELYFC